ncbi:hypothetical protein [Candidatus Hamiltonella defensa]|uniref:Uncharacterized protein n=1 Tax=Hamiltonella defensa subsp. Acyrthosiphon pisum (strain 5AT) TaxID=572265 RepID=C4K3M6_HAMD5|nr:hypothetical protein [Candidatus Hamiltonella defensa]ACQ67169.1 hypothetical protein HDEF_0415 [Candidatus Hamiltonella defensa 5AT (Acyrthosiphon pisum)]ATW21938.1 hypothetical protein BJP44_01930 [Candidatus Hamiltonella defensa]
MWWKIAMASIFMMMVFFVIGLFVGGGVYLLLIGGSFGQVTLTTLIESGAFSLTDRQKIFLPWAWCVTVALTFLPLGLTLFVLLLGKTPKKSLHGDARFANKKELNAFKYRGNYQ